MQTAALISNIVEKASKVFIFRTYNAKDCLYHLISDANKLRSQISLAVRYARKKIGKGQTAKIKTDESEKYKQRISSSRTTIAIDTQENHHNNQDSVSMMGYDPRKFKRFKKDESNNCFGGNSKGLDRL